MGADFLGQARGGHRHSSQLSRGGRQADGVAIPGGVDFSNCVTDPDTGLCCVDKLEEVTSLQKDPILECTHKNVEQCHYTYVTQFTPSQEEVSKNHHVFENLTFKIVALRQNFHDLPSFFSELG